MNILFDDHHREIQNKTRQFVETEILPHVEQWDEQGTSPFHLLPQAAELGLLGPHFPTDFGGQGFLMDNSVQRFFRDAPVYTIGGGTSQIQKEIIARQLGL